MATTDQQDWNASVDTRNGRYVILVKRGEEPAGMITCLEDDPIEVAQRIAEGINGLRIG